MMMLAGMVVIQLLLLQQPPYLRDQVVGITPAASPMREAGYVVLSESCGAVPVPASRVVVAKRGPSEVLTSNYYLQLSSLGD